MTQAGYVIDDYAPYCVSHGVCTQQEANECIAEARFMRALAYWFLAMYWHDVPIITNAVTASETAYANRFEDVLQFAICEAEYARKWLPVTPGQTGRVTKTSADVLLSRLYLTAGAYAKGGHYSADFKATVLDRYYADDADYQAALSLRGVLLRQGRGRSHARNKRCPGGRLRPDGRLRADMARAEQQ